MSEEAQQVEEQGGTVEAPEIETRARSMGWVPKDEFKGDPEKWREADEFVKRGEDYLPILKSRNEKLERKLSDLQTTVREFADHHKKVAEIAYQKALKELQKQKEEAIELGDKAKVKEVEAEMKDLETTKMPDKPAAPPREANEHYADFVKENKTWWEKDADMTEYARAQAAYIERRMPDISVNTSAYFDEVVKRVRKEFPEKFENERRRQPSTVHGAGAESIGGKGGKFADLPADAKAQCDRWVREGLLSREQYLKDYYGE